jgi:hypothetical protein
VKIIIIVLPWRKNYKNITLQLLQPSFWVMADRSLENIPVRNEVSNISKVKPGNLSVKSPTPDHQFGGF